MSWIRRFAVKQYIRIKQKEWKEHGKKIKYIFDKEENSEYLIVSFSGFGTKAGYNYMRTLKGVKANKLYILDDLGRKDYPGTYYLGENGDYQYKEYVMNLIRQILKESDANRIITVGSSKGGWAALYFGFRLDAYAVVAGAPQYYLGNYLDCEFHQKTFEIMVGKDVFQNKEILNDFLPEMVHNAQSGNVYLHFSDKEHTYVNHIKYLDKDLKQNTNIKYFWNVEHYEDHPEVGKFFPKYLLATVNSLVEKGAQV